MLLHEPGAISIRKGPPRLLDAVTPIPASASSYEMTSEDDIGDTLTLLATHGDAISMYGVGSRDPILGRILSVDPELPHFVMELNEGASLPSGKITFVAVLRNAKFQFRLNKLDWDSVPGKPQLIPMDFPETCAVLDRRSAERVETPLGASYMASFVINDTPYELPIYDLATGGVGLRCAKIAAKGLLKGRKLKDVQLDLGEETTIIVPEMEVRYTRSCRSFLLGEQLHIGCMFHNMDPEEQGKLKAILEKIDHTPLRER